MIYKNKVKALLYILICFVTLYMTSCSKVIHGYISDDIYYQVNPFNVQQGVTTTSASLIGNGSTAPLQVELLSIANLESGKSVDSLFLTPKSIVTYTGTVTYQDSTLAMLNSKLKDSLVAPFSVNSVGGRLQFTQASEYVDTGSYVLNLKVSNVRGEKILDNACVINLLPLTNLSEITYTACTTSPDAALSSTVTVNSALSINIDYVGNNSENKIIFKFLDKNNKPFNPLIGEVKGRSGRPNFGDWDPYYAPFKTDSTIEYQYPEGVPELPMYDESVYGSGFGRGIIYYQIQGQYTDIGMFINPVATILYYKTKGTYVVTYKLSNVAHK